jgi:hypothetical protein
MALMLENALRPSTKPPTRFCVNADAAIDFADLLEAFMADRFEVVGPERLTLTFVMFKL